MARFPKKLEQKLEKRRQEDALRSLPKPQSLVDFSSNDYLGLAQKKQVADATLKLLEQSNIHSNGATGSRLLSGNHFLYQKLEDFLSEYHNAESALVFNSGYDANIGFFSSVPQRGDVVFYDEFIHASIRDGIQMGNAKSYKFKHNDLQDLQNKVETALRTTNFSHPEPVEGLPKNIERRLLSGVEASRNEVEASRNDQSNDTEIYIVTESVFSMDGDSPNLKALADFCAENDYHLIVDEAHAVGIFGEGKGLVSQLDFENEVFARIITFGKALGTHGAAILGSGALKAYLVNFARSLIYTTALSPHGVASILTAYLYLQNEGASEQAKLLDNIQYFKEELIAFGLQANFIKSDAAIQCLVLPGNENVKQLAQQLNQEGFEVKPILSPTVKKGKERLRFCLHSYNTKEEIKSALGIVKTKI